MEPALYLVCFASLAVLFHEFTETVNKRNEKPMLIVNRFFKMLEEKSSAKPALLPHKLLNLFFPGCNWEYGNETTWNRKRNTARDQRNRDNIKYLLYKIGGMILFPVIVANDATLLMQLFYALLGFMFYDFLIYMKKRKKRNKIRSELPAMMEKISRSISAGVPLSEVFNLLAVRLNGPLREEVSLLSARYNLYGNLAKCLSEFSERLQMPEVDNLCLTLQQGEQSGRMKRMLDSQIKMLRRRERFQLFKSTKNRANFLPLATVGMVINILLLTVTPMLLSIITNGNLFR